MLQRIGILVAVIVILVAMFLLAGCGEDSSSKAVLDEKNTKQAAANTSQSQVSQETAVILNPETRKQLNTFFSNFSEAGVRPFATGQIPESTLIDFGVRHNMINREQVINNGKLSAQEVDKACQNISARHRLTIILPAAFGMPTVIIPCRKHPVRHMYFHKLSACLTVGTVLTRLW